MWQAGKVLMPNRSGCEKKNCVEKMATKQMKNKTLGKVEC